jgi:arylsulfatase
MRLSAVTGAGAGDVADDCGTSTPLHAETQSQEINTQQRMPRQRSMRPRPGEKSRGDRGRFLDAAVHKRHFSGMRTPVALCLALCCSRPALADDSRELILLVLFDAVRADHVGAYGYTRGTTPTLDGLAQRGVRFTRAYTNAPWTRASTACYLTGLNASRHRTQTDKSRLPADVVTLAERLEKAGWKTAGFSANGNGGSLAGFDRGFSLFRDPTHGFDKAKRGKTYNGLPSAEFLTQQVLGHLKGSTAKKEFLFIFYVDPHDPYGAPPVLEKKFLGDFKGTVRRKASWEKDNAYPEDERFSMQALYDAGIYYADSQVGVLLEGIEKLGRLGQTTLFFSSDHGEGFGEHGFYLHAHQFWEEVVHIPLVAFGPRFPAGVDERLTQTLDVTATIAELAGADTTGLMGRSLLHPADPDRPVISEYNEYGIHRQMIVGKSHKVIWQKPADEAWYLASFPNKVSDAEKKALFPSVSFDREVVQVFDLAADPFEKQNLAEKMPAPAAALLATLREFVAAAPAK